MGDVGIAEIIAIFASLQLSNELVVHGGTPDGYIEVHAQFTVGLMDDGGVHHPLGDPGWIRQCCG